MHLFSVGRVNPTSRPKVAEDRHVITGVFPYFASYHADQLSLLMLQLIMQAHNTFRCDLEWLSCTKSRPRLAKVRRFQLSVKKPRASPNTFGSMMQTSGMAVRISCIRTPSRATGQADRHRNRSWRAAGRALRVAHRRSSPGARRFLRDRRP